MVNTWADYGMTQADFSRWIGKQEKNSYLRVVDYFSPEVPNFRFNHWLYVRGCISEIYLGLPW